MKKLGRMALIPSGFITLFKAWILNIEQWMRKLTTRNKINKENTFVIYLDKPPTKLKQINKQTSLSLHLRI